MDSLSIGCIAVKICQEQYNNVQTLQIQFCLS
nr:MAG TPA: hypothetical protein [Caudoviricetes sp.]